MVSDTLKLRNVRHSCPLAALMVHNVSTAGLAQSRHPQPTGLPRCSFAEAAVRIGALHFSWLVVGSAKKTSVRPGYF
ncbi:hypothetical protein C8N36_113121 [Pelagimonas varians]|uniref:Uncharacterized protein n=1 Tax=Pelagimonas varians TaxID=696760 RepID=A0A238KVZ1_9RHOB|nr:hypothetical protein C8N36_113121 [Pelagimonas varians]SMX46771.1 hypothetical protein PEV8663_03381 [Pelagimonas varians]